jgi:hypothetical protein
MAAMTNALVAKLREQPWYADSDTKAFSPSAPTMLAPYEAGMLRWLAAHAYTGRGDIADLGCFLGGSTCCFGDGLRANPNTQPRRSIHSYDMLVTPNDPFDSYANSLIGPAKKAGDSFRDLFDANTAAYADLIEVHQGDLREQMAPPRQIEILFIDIAKSSSLNDHIVRNFFSRTIGPGAIIAHQDYNHPWLPWVHITANLLRPVCEYVGDVAGTRLVVQTNAITPAMLARCLDAATSYDEKIAILENERDQNENRYSAALVHLSSAWLAFIECGPVAFEARLDHPLLLEQYIPEQVERVRLSAHTYFEGTRAGYDAYERKYFFTTRPLSNLMEPRSQHGRGALGWPRVFVWGPSCQS